MADRDDPDLAAYEDALARLEKVTSQVRRHEAAAETLRGNAGEIAVEAMRIGLKIHRKRMRTEVLKRSPFSHTTLRDLADAAGIPPDERYVRTSANKPED